MSRLAWAWAVLVLLGGAPTVGRAASAVFDGDPTDPASGLPYEILPGAPLVLPGPDALYGTADDTVDPGSVGDIDVVVRSGSLPASAIIPPPAAQSGRGALPVGTAGSSVAGGIEIPFTVFLSDGAASGEAPFGHLLPAADMDGLPVVVAAFADLDADGIIGITNNDVAGSTDNHLEARELEVVGRAVAVFSGGVARGSLAIQAGGPASRGGRTVAICAMALTGPFDPGFFDGSIPSGPAILTAFPFLPQRDLARLIRGPAVPAGPDTTLQRVIHFAALPTDAAMPFGLALDGRSPTIDVAVVNAQPAVRAAFRENLATPALAAPVDDLVLGSRAPSSSRQLLVVPVDRWNNPADPPPGFAVTLRVTPRGRQQELLLSSAAGATITVRAEGTTGVITAERNGMVVAALPYRVDARVNLPAADVTVPSPVAGTIQAGIDGVSDGNRDGILVVRIQAGLYREAVVVDRSVTLLGDGVGATILQGDGSTGVVAVTAPNAAVRGLTAVGGAWGFDLAGSSSLLMESRAWSNLGAGVRVAGSNAQVWRTAAVQNAGDGLAVGANGVVCTDSDLSDNGGIGVSLTDADNGQIERNRIAENGTGGISLDTANGTAVIDNQSAGNIGSGLELRAAQGNLIAGNLCAVNDEDGMSMESTADSLVSDNAFDTNHGYGLFVRRSTNDDFAIAPGTQAPLGDNRATDNRKRDLFVRAK